MQFRSRLSRNKNNISLSGFGGLNFGAYFYRLIRCGLIVRKVLVVSTFLILGHLQIWGEEIPESQDRPTTRQEIFLRSRITKSRSLTPYRITGFERRFLKYEKRPLWQKLTLKGHHGFRLLLGGMRSGSGLSYGVGYVKGRDRDALKLSIRAMHSTKMYQQLDGLAEFPTPVSGSPVQAYIKAGYRDYRQVNFFGLGPSSGKSSESTFRFQDRRLAGGVKILSRDLFEIGGEIGLINTHIFPGRRSPSLEENFVISQTPGFLDSPEYLTYGGYMQLKIFDSGFPPAGVRFRLGLDRFAERGREFFSFTRVTGEISILTPLGFRNRRLAVRVRTSHSMPDSGHRVPFFMMETVGGFRSLRGFQEYRFRDYRNLVLNLEYRWEVWPHADFVIFGDMGKVFEKSRDLDLSGLEKSIGFGMRAELEGLRFRIDFAKSEEGFRIYFGGGPLF